MFKIFRNFKKGKCLIFFQDDLERPDVVAYSKSKNKPKVMRTFWY